MIKIYNVYHNESHLISNKIITPIQVGAGETINQISLRDNSGDNISEKNPTFCELTAQYWIWKNDLDSDYIGLFHYRRYLDLKNIGFGKEFSDDVYGMKEIPSFNLSFMDDYGLSESDIKTVLSDVDVIFPKIWDVKKIGYKNIYDHYVKSKYHHKRDIDETRNVIKDIFPDDVQYFDQVMNSSEGIWTNLFLFKKKYFDEYSQWLFTILFELEKRLDISYYDIQEKRVFGYISERLINVWLLRKTNSTPGFKIKYADRVFVKDTTVKKFSVPDVTEKNKKVISLVIAADDNYVPHMAVLLLSIADYLNKDYFLDLIILNGGISELNQFLIKKQLNSKLLDCQVSFIDLYNEFKDLGVHMHFSRATYYRLILPDILINRDKVLYLDTDTIVQSDISEIFNIDITKFALAACHDYIMESFCSKNILSLDQTGALPAKQYLQSYVGLGNKYSEYFQAGVILFNLKKIREMNVSSMMIKSLSTTKYWFLDQDILNKYFHNSFYALDTVWNVVNIGKEVFDGLSSEGKKKLDYDIKNPKVIHYAGYDAKPWNNPKAYFNEIYFFYLRQSYWYEQVTSIMQSGQYLVPFSDKSVIWKRCREIWLKMPLSMRRKLSRIKDYLRDRL